MASRFDIQVKLHFQGRQREGLIDAGDVLKLLDVVEAAVYDSDRDDVIRAATALQIRSVERDACLERLRHYRHKRLLLEDARPGSLELVGLIAAVGYFVLEKTIGESFSDGYKNSELHRRLKEFFQRLIDEKALKIAESIERVIRSRKVQARLRILPPEDNNSPRIFVIDVLPVQRLSDTEDIKTLGQALE